MTAPGAIPAVARKNRKPNRGIPGVARVRVWIGGHNL
jgi:hypothetical protein